MPIFFRDLDHFKTESGYELDGNWYPRVTAIIGIKAKPALYRYYSQHTDYESAISSLNKAAQEGQLLHDKIEAFLAGQNPVIPATILPAFEALNKLLTKTTIKPLMIEHKIKSDKHWYAGTVDLLAEVNGKAGVIDIKTSAAIYRDYNIQTAAYIEALKEYEHTNLERWILRLDQNRRCLLCGAKLRLKGGNSKVRGGYNNCAHQWSELQGELEFKKLRDLEHDTTAFLACKQLWEWENKRWLKKLAPRVATLL